MDERKRKYLNSDKGTEYARCREYKRWTPEDDKLILTDAEGVHDLHLALLLGRSIQAIQCRRSRLLRKVKDDNIINGRPGEDPDRS